MSDLKMAVRRALPADGCVDAALAAGGSRTFTIGELAKAILTRAPGQKLAYLTDIGATDDNLDRAAKLVQGADLLICEAAFLHADETLARERLHLTARQAGELARAAGAHKLAPFHFSPRYSGREQELVAEAATAFG